MPNCTNFTSLCNLTCLDVEIVVSMVTSDGTNDSPYLHEAYIGLVMGIAGREVAKKKKIC